MSSTEVRARHAISLVMSVFRQVTEIRLAEGRMRLASYLPASRLKAARKASLPLPSSSVGYVTDEYECVDFMGLGFVDADMGADARRLQGRA